MSKAVKPASLIKTITCGDAVWHNKYGVPPLPHIHRLCFCCAPRRPVIHGLAWCLFLMRQTFHDTAKSGGRAMGSGEISHTGSSEINFPWLPKALRGETEPLNWAAGEERQPPLARRERAPHANPRPLTPICYCICHRRADVIIAMEREPARAPRRSRAAILSHEWRRLYHGGRCCAARRIGASPAPLEELVCSC